MNIFGKFMKTAATTFIKNKPAIMTGIALVSLGTTVLITMREAPVIKEVVDEKKALIDDINASEELGEEEKKDYIRDEVTDAAKRIAVPACKIVLVTAITAFSIFGINKAHTAREIAASALLESYKNQVAGYEEKIPGILGKQKAEELRHDVIVEAAEKASENHKTNSESLKGITYVDKLPVLDDYGNRWVASRSDIDKALNVAERDKGEGRCGRRPINYADWIADNFEHVSVTESSKALWFDAMEIASAEVSSRYDNFLDTIGYMIHFTEGAPVNEDMIDGRYA